MSKKKERTRLQGESWHTLKDKLTPCNYYTEENGHVKGIFKDDAGNQYIHWLNDQEIEEYRNKKDKYISGQIEFEVEDGSMTAEEFSNMFNQSLDDQFKRIQNTKGKNHTTISTTVNIGTRHDDAADALSEFARFKLREQNAVYGLDTGEGEDQSVNYYQVINDNPNLTKSSANHGNYGTPNYTTVKIDLPKRYLNISEDLDRVLESSDLMKTLNELVLRDKQEAYVRELLNRIDRCCRWLEANKCYEIDCNIPIAILKNNVSYIKERYDLICDIRSWDNYYVKDGEDVLAEILGVKDENNKK